LEEGRGVLEGVGEYRGGGGGGGGGGGLLDIACRVIGCNLTQQTKMQNAFDDVANTILQSLASGERFCGEQRMQSVHAGARPYDIPTNCRFRPRQRRGVRAGVLGRELFTSTSQLILSRFQSLTDLTSRRHHGCTPVHLSTQLELLLTLSHRRHQRLILIHLSAEPEPVLSLKPPNVLRLSRKLDDRMYSTEVAHI